MKKLSFCLLIIIKNQRYIYINQARSSSSQQPFHQYCLDPPLFPTSALIPLQLRICPQTPPHQLLPRFPLTLMPLRPPRILYPCLLPWTLPMNHLGLVVVIVILRTPMRMGRARGRKRSMRLGQEKFDRKRMGKIVTSLIKLGIELNSLLLKMKSNS